MSAHVFDTWNEDAGDTEALLINEADISEMLGGTAHRFFSGKAADLQEEILTNPVAIV